MARRRGDAAIADPADRRSRRVAALGQGARSRRQRLSRPSGRPQRIAGAGAHPDPPQAPAGPAARELQPQPVLGAHRRADRPLQPALCLRAYDRADGAAFRRQRRDHRHDVRYRPFQAGQRPLWASRGRRCTARARQARAAQCAQRRSGRPLGWRGICRRDARDKSRRRDDRRRPAPPGGRRRALPRRDRRQAAGHDQHWSRDYRPARRYPRGPAKARR